MGSADVMGLFFIVHGILATIYGIPATTHKLLAAIHESPATFREIPAVIREISVAPSSSRLCAVVRVPVSHRYTFSLARLFDRTFTSSASFGKRVAKQFEGYGSPVQHTVGGSDFRRHGMPLLPLKGLYNSNHVISPCQGWRDPNGFSL